MVIQLKNQDHIQGPRLSDCRIQGSIADLMERFFAGRINSETARNVVYREAADAFRNQLDDESGVIGIWQGEFWANGSFPPSGCASIRRTPS